ncbi:asparagine synthase C-terminal domain-containing protein [Inquilinus limosus]|uniref:asparagine synthase-related protein n=1 Tax=Inquilinus limosus TaxID=171674 RepID=UPI00047CC982|nr:asparagine synthase C-terminal domain-containing protein [Inquilinus limosus]
MMIRELASSGTQLPMGFQRREKQAAMEISVPLTGTEQLYYRTDEKPHQISDDLRALHVAHDELDETAIYSYLQFGAVVPPLSPWKAIRRFIPGTTATISNTGIQTLPRQPSLRPLPKASPSPDIEQQISTVVAALDRCLLQHCAGRPVTILFSGGVDSGLLAARASALGLKNVTLVNYCFGPNDPESMLAEQMARHLGLKFVRIVEDTGGSDVADVLQHAGRYYRTLFGDHSAAPTCAMIRAIIPRCEPGGVVLEGTGADSGFGEFGRAMQWQRVYSLPAWGRKLGAAAYRTTRAWGRVSKLEYYLRILRRADQLPHPFSAVAENALRGIAYHPSKDIISAIEEHLLQWLPHMSPPDPRLQLAAFDLSLGCASITAQKSRSLFDGTSLDVVYPYLLPDMIDVAFASVDWPGSGTEVKRVLKAALARHVPAAMVYRAKSGFVASMPDKFGHKAFLTAFDKLLEPRSPLGRFLDRKFLLGIRPKLAAKRKLPPQTEYFLWCAVFGNEWIEQVSRRSLNS